MGVFTRILGEIAGANHNLVRNLTRLANQNSTYPRNRISDSNRKLHVEIWEVVCVIKNEVVPKGGKHKS
jgi:hypothetical protein